MQLTLFGLCVFVSVFLELDRLSGGLFSRETKRARLIWLGSILRPGDGSLHWPGAAGRRPSDFSKSAALELETRASNQLGMGGCDRSLGLIPHSFIKNQLKLTRDFLGYE